ncbi:MAG: hypothetical protein ANABAC_3374 [Anaerolineae bacterium]|jgi:hydroxymethylglutaryl-CoA reductase|nr:MAG: hypothetical protein ANABAC_3374 [Anaerolineae bacterium]
MIEEKTNGQSLHCPFAVDWPALVSSIVNGADLFKLLVD